MTWNNKPFTRKIAMVEHVMLFTTFQDPESSQKEGAVLPRARSIAEIIEPGDDAPDLQNNEMIVQIPFCLIPAGRSAPM